MENTQQSEILALAEAIHGACAASAGGSAGNCKDATLAFALALEPIGEPVAICQGHVVVATSAFADSQSAAVEEVAPQVQEPAPVVSRFSAVRKSLVGKLWQKFMS